MDIRNPSPAEVEDIVARVSRAFGYKEGEGDVARDFPQLYDPSNYKHLWAAYAGGELAAHAGFYPAVMKVESLPLPVAGIGGVFTEEAHRSQGFARHLINKCCEEAARGGAALAFLWSDQHEFYAKLGFHLVGRQWTLTLEPGHAAALRAQGEKEGLGAAQVRIVEGEITPEFLEQSYRWQERLPLGIARSPEEHRRLLASGAGQVFSAWVGRDLTAYFVIGKGKDLGNYVHEWAGDEAGLHHLGAAVLEVAKAPIFVLSPQFMPDEVRWIYTLDELGIGMRGEKLALVRILDLEKVRQLLSSYLARLGATEGNLVVEPEGEAYAIGWRGQREPCDERHLLAFLFGPELPENAELRGYLPLRLWYWGMDSV